MFITSNEELAVAIERMRLAGTDLAECELKSAAGGFPKSTAETISAFTNTLGGSLVFGIAEKGGFMRLTALTSSSCNLDAPISLESS